MPSGSGGTLGIVEHPLPLKRKIAAPINPIVDLFAFSLLFIPDFVDLPFLSSRCEFFHDLCHNRDGLQEGKNGSPHGIRA